MFILVWGCRGRWDRCLQGGVVWQRLCLPGPGMATVGVFQAESKSLQQAALAHVFLPQNSSYLSCRLSSQGPPCASQTFFTGPPTTHTWHMPQTFPPL